LCYKTALNRPRRLVTNFSGDRVYLSQDAEDAALVARCRAGDQVGFELLVRRHERVLFNVALRMVGNRDEAADATQNAFVKVYQHLGDFDVTRRFFSWLYRILVNECLNILRARPRASEEIGSAAETGDGPFETLARSERHRRIQAALMALSPEYREVVVLRHFAGLSYDEIADSVGVPAKTVKSRLYSARQRLGELLLDWEPGT
jgi:RNA polymerase sigma-70 factor (ECF subfamily)